MSETPILRTSERKAFKRCQAQWWWGYREGLKPRGSEATPLWFGTGFHLGLERWYVPGTKRGIHPAETWRTYAEGALNTIKVSDATEERVAEYEDGAKLGEILCEEYVKHYGQDDHMDIIQAEQVFNLPIPWPDATRQGLYEVEPGAILVDYNGCYDGVYRDLNDGKLKLLETKTARSVITSHLSLDDQAGSYWAMAAITLRRKGLISEKERLHGITYNFARKGLPDERPRDGEGYACNKPTKAHYVEALKDVVADHSAASLGKLKVESLQEIAQGYGLEILGERSKVQPAPLFERVDVWRTSKERNSQLRRIQDEAVQMQAVRDGLLPIVKNPSRDCSWCQFKQMCELQEQQGDWQEFKRLAFKVEDPYANYRKSAEE